MLCDAGCGDKATSYLLNKLNLYEGAVPIRGSDRTIDGVLIPLGHRRLMLRVFPSIEKFNLKNEAIGVTS